jgi:hypothetical protein
MDYLSTHDRSTQYVQTFKMMVAICHMDMILKHLETKMIQGTLVSMPLINTTGCRSV